MGERYSRRIGYSWIELARREADGRARYLTLGVGLSAVSGRAQVESWFFLLEGNGDAADPRIGQDVWLTTADRQVLTRERLRETLAGRGLLFENNAQGYRRAVDERLFHLGAQRYAALMDTLIQLRQPQLSRKPDEVGLSNALSQSLPPLPVDLLSDVAEALNRLEEDRRQLQDSQRLEQAVSRFEQRYRVYAGILARRQARELRQAQTGFDKASEARSRAHADCEEKLATSHEASAAVERARQASVTAREHLQTLQSDPANQDANRLVRAEDDSRQRERGAQAAGKRSLDALAALQRESERSRQRADAAEQARLALHAGRTRALDGAGAVGLDGAFVVHPLFALSLDALATGVPTTSDALHEATRQRRRDIDLLRRRHGEIDRLKTVLGERNGAVQTAREDTTGALSRREQADRNADVVGESLASAWATHCAGLRHLVLDADATLAQLADWIARPEGHNPAQAALDRARQDALHRQATRKAALDAGQQALRDQRRELDIERERLLSGVIARPQPPLTRAADARTNRAGAPLWQVVDFQPALDAGARAGREAALEASGLLDAWVSPQGELSGTDGSVLLDSRWQRRGAVTGPNLRDALIPTPTPDCGITADALDALLAGIACGARDGGDAESWLSPRGQFRLGALAGAWTKPAASHIGHVARERARRERLAAIAIELARLDAADVDLVQQQEALENERVQSEREWRFAPSEHALRESIALAMAAAREVEHARARLEQAEQRAREIEGTLHDAREQLQRDAADLHLPAEAERLAEAEANLHACEQTLAALIQAARDWRRAWPEHVEQQERERETRDVAEDTERVRIDAEAMAAKARTHFETLRESVGQKVEALRARLGAADQASRHAEEMLEHCRRAASEADKAHAIASTQVEQAQRTLDERIGHRAEAVERLRQFAGCGLLASALPEQELPAQWSVDPALNLARQIERDLARVDDDEQAWGRVQKQVSEDLGELQRGLSAMGHQAASEPNDFGLTVFIRYQNRAERPDTLARLLAQDIAQRSELLSARERELLENHLQAEIAAEIQRLMRAADERVKAINAELYARPTTTGVRYRLQWEPRAVEEGAPAGLDVARQRLLNTSADLWSPADRDAVGQMLQQQIASERARADADANGGAMIDQLSRALDYRHWHVFRIQRLQDGQWRKLSGPASSGERALGLTVPLFAAIASFYEHGGSRLAPRLMLLDEAFAGIDDSARAHCMGLVREFDLDFVITSEREWACYAELPGVSIAQLQRREGIDAVHVSRWTWDGRARRRETDPDRRFPPTP